MFPESVRLEQERDRPQRHRRPEPVREWAERVREWAERVRSEQVRRSAYG